MVPCILKRMDAPLTAASHTCFPHTCTAHLHPFVIFLMAGVRGARRVLGEVARSEI